MTLADFFLAINAADIRLANSGGRLQLRGPAGAITPEISAGAAEHKATILSLLTPAAPDGAPKDLTEEPALFAREGGPSVAGTAALPAVAISGVEYPYEPRWAGRCLLPADGYLALDTETAV